jgi:hypothetical protein
MSFCRNILPKEKIVEILKIANERRYSPQVQAEMNKVDHSAWFGYVVDQMHRGILKEMGYGSNLEEALDELYSCRWRFRHDEDMNNFFKTLIHVQMDFTADGPIGHGDPAVDAALVTFEGKPIRFQSFLDKANETNRPLVVFAGSGT